MSDDGAKGDDRDDTRGRVDLARHVRGRVDLARHMRGRVDLARHVRVVRPGTGANCSSIGSVVDMLFAGAVVGGALFAAACAALETETSAPSSDPGEPDGAAADSPSTDTHEG